MLFPFSILSLCKANFFNDEIKQSALNRLETFGIKISDDMTHSFIELVAFTVPKLTEFREVTLEIVEKYSSDKNNIYRMADDLLSGKNSDLFDEIQKFSKTSKHSEYLHFLLLKIKSLYLNTINANKSFAASSLINHSSLYMKIPLEYRALLYMALSEVKMMLSLLTMFNQNQHPLLEFYIYLVNGATGKSVSKVFNFISEDVKQNLIDKPEMAKKYEIIKSFYSTARAMLLGSFGQISAAEGNINFDDQIKNLSEKFLNFQNELNNIVQEVNAKEEVL